MPTRQDPAVQRRRLRAELKKAREAAGKTQKDVAQAMEWSPSKVIRIESGVVGISTNDLKALLSHYGLKDKGQINGLVELARGSKEESWYDRHEAVLSPGFRDYLAYEASASIIRQFEPILIPGLLQTEEYARAVLKGAYRLDPARVDRLWAVRAQRQELHDLDDPPQMFFILDEPALRRWVGGPRVMRRQLERLKDFAVAPHVTIQILPFTLGAHAGMTGPFIVLEFASPGLDDIVHLESAGEATLRDKPETTAKYLETFWALEELALSPDEVPAFLDRLIGKLPQSADAVPAGAATNN
jgi:transcriptional regulator with XRE-family HTH domain